MVITGTGFTGATHVTIGTGACTSVVVDSDTQISATLPASVFYASGGAPTVMTPPGVYGVTVRSSTGGWTISALGLVTLTALGPPLAVSSDRTVVPAGANTVVTVNFLADGTTVDTNAINGTTFSRGTGGTGAGRPSSTQYAVNTPAVPAGPLTVTFGTYGSLPSNAWPLTVADPPVPTSITPNTGPAAGGTPVTIGGSGFTDSTGVVFAVTHATSFVVVSHTQITCVTPPHAAGAVAVSLEHPVAPVIVPGAFTYTGTGAESDEHAGRHRRTKPK